MLSKPTTKIDHIDTLCVDFPVEPAPNDDTALDHPNDDEKVNVKKVRNMPEH